MSLLGDRSHTTRGVTFGITVSGVTVPIVAYEDSNNPGCYRLGVDTELTIASGIVVEIDTTPLAKETTLQQIRTNTQNIYTAVNIMDDWDEADRAKVNPIVGQAGVSADFGNVDARTQRTVEANDSPLTSGIDSLNSFVIALELDSGNTTSTTQRVVEASDSPLTSGVNAIVTGLQVPYFTPGQIVVVSGIDNTYYYYYDMEKARFLSTQLELDGGSGSVTATLEATVQDDGTPQGSCIYQDVTSDLFGVANATSDDLWILDTPTPFKYVRVKIIALTGGANDASWSIYSKLMS